MSESLGSRVRTLRQKRGYSQQDLANGAQCEQTLVSRVESRKDYEPGVFTLYRIARALGTTLDGLLEGVIDFTPAPIVKNSGAPAELVARLGEEVAVLHKSQTQIVDTLAQVSKAVTEVRKEVRELRDSRPKARR